MGKYQHGPVHYKPMVWKSAKKNRAKHEERIRQNRVILKSCKEALQEKEA
jgi:hypothetical protein